MQKFPWFTVRRLRDSFSLSTLNRAPAAFSIVILLLSAGWIIASRLPAERVAGEQPAPRPGFLAPDFTLEVAGGGQITLSDLRGKVVLLNLWASWCLPCRAEAPALERAYQLYKDQGVIILGVNATYQDSEQNAAAFVQENGLTFPIVYDRDGAVSRRYALAALPASFFIGRDGVIRSVAVGGLMNESMIQTKIEELLQEGR